jgi:stage II sporulation protein AA (anti-sigma F factor antagonist)
VTLKITTVRKGRTAVVTFCGNIDVYTASSVGEAIQSLVVDGALNVILNLASVARVDSSGLGTLVGNSKAITSAGGVLCLVDLTPGMLRTLKITNLAKYFRIYDTQRDALEELEGCTVGGPPTWAGGS